MMGKAKLTAIALAAALATAPAPAQAADFATCVASVSQDYAAAKTRYQQDLRDLIVAEQPDLMPLADINMQLQSALAEARHLKMLHLIGTDPKRITADQGLSRFANFDWSDQDTATLAASSDAFRAIDEHTRALKQQNNGHDQWPALRTFAQGPMLKHPGFKSLTERFIATNTSLADRLKACPPAPD